MLVVVSGSFTLAFGADFTFQISGLGLSKCHSSPGAVNPKSASAAATQQDRLRKCSLTSVSSPYRTDIAACNKGTIP